MRSYQFGLLTLFAILTTACFAAWGAPTIVPAAWAIIKMGDWKILAAVVAGIFAFSFWLVANR